ncbi:hypothetical protein B6D87_23100 (plasmid) [Pseudomonas fragi]|uniref:type III toxin-antitoxin system TenpIN family toxin n=1 Tax=Pseudomonas fragi TaxID=296 RepID=UPI000A2A37AC|nr:hypothetical protein [Pseudomonas fragi]ARQ77072.1 hypothetical protein B6D87_23100 [Pseudomonas fragi]
MLLRKLETLFYDENTHLVEVLDKTGDHWDAVKTRGYGIVVIELDGLKFGIPLRSHIHPRNKHCFITTERKGLDYSKAVLLAKDEYISDVPFQIPNDEIKKLRDSAYVIGKQFSKYVARYVRYTKEDPTASVLKREYLYSTLVNYHAELGI